MAGERHGHGMLFVNRSLEVLSRDRDMYRVSWTARHGAPFRCTVLVAGGNVQLYRLSNYARYSGYSDSEINIRLNVRQAHKVIS